MKIVHAVVLSVLLCAFTVPVWADPVGLQNATADSSQPGYTVGNVLTDDANGWASGPSFLDQSAVFETVTDQGDRIFTFVMKHNSIHAQHGVGKFGLSATGDGRATFADGLANGGDITAAWTSMEILSAVSLGGATMTVNPDNTILVSGTNPANDTYVVRAMAPMSTGAAITGFRLDTIQDGSLPNNGPGRFGANGNYVLTSVQASEIQVQLQNATAVHSQASLDVSNTIDGAYGAGFGTGWGNSVGGDNTAAYETVADLGELGGTFVRFTLDARSFGQHTIGNFRISLTSDDRSTFADGLQNGGDVTAAWGEVHALNAYSTGGATLTINADNTILVSGANPNEDTYVIEAIVGRQDITGVRLEAIEDASLAGNGPGRAFNGNFVLTEFIMEAREHKPASQVLLQNATALRSQLSFGGLTVDRAIDGAKISGNASGWGNDVGGENTAVFETQSDVGEGLSLITFVMDFRSFGDHKIGNFRFSATTEDRANFADGAANGGDLGLDSIWHHLEIVDAFTATGDRLEINTTDWTVLLDESTSGDAANDVFTVVARAGFHGITGFRLEALNNALNAVAGQPGTTDSNGNFVLTELEVYITTIPTPAALPAGLIGLALITRRRGRGVRPVRR